jgi:hypothetical protein
VVNILALRQVFLLVHLFCLVGFILLMLYTHLHINDTLYQKDKRGSLRNFGYQGVNESKERSFCYTSLRVKGIAFKDAFRLLHVCFHMLRYSRGIQSHSVPCGLGSRVRPLRGRLSPIQVAKLLPSASSFRFCECSCMGGRERVG